MLRTINVYKLLTIIFTGVLTLILFNQVVSETLLLGNVALAAPDSVNCVQGKNGITGTGCGGTVTLKLGAGGVIKNSTGYGLQVNNTSTSNSSAGVYVKIGSGSGLPVVGGSALGIIGDSDNGIAVGGLSKSNDGVYGFSSNHVGVEADSDTGIGLEGASNTGAGIKGTSNNSDAIQGVSVNGAGVKGSSNSGVGVKGIGTGNDGVDGKSTGGYGVYGNSKNSTGVYGHSDNYYGVRGQSNTDFAFYSDGDVAQQLGAGGWVKAMARFGGGGITRCYTGQSQLPNRTAPCGFTLTKNAAGDYSIDFKFQVNNRFVSVTPEWASNSAVIPVVSFPSLDVVRVQTYSSGTTPVDSAFFVMIY